MDYTVRHIPDDTFWTALAEAPAVADVTTGTVPPFQLLKFDVYAHLALQPFNTLLDWNRDQFYTFPGSASIPEPITGISYFISPPSRKAKNLRRVFAAFTFGTQGDKGILVEVTPLQLTVVADGVRTPDGNVYYPLTSSVVAKGDGAPIFIDLQDRSTGSGITIIEEPNEQDVTLPSDLFIDITNPRLARGHINRKAKVLNDLYGYNNP